MVSLNYRDINLVESVPNRNVPFKTIFISSCMYVVWSDGTIWNVKQGRYQSLDTDEEGYKIAHLGSKTVKVHRLVLMLFDRKPKHNEETRHLDGDPANNNISNLKWGTAFENWDDRRKHGRVNASKGSKKRGSKLTIEQVLEIRKDVRTNIKIAKDYNVDPGTISNIRLNKTWRGVECQD